MTLQNKCHQKFSVKLWMTKALLGAVIMMSTEAQRTYSLGAEATSTQAATVKVLATSNRYSLHDSVLLYVAIINSGDSPLYLDRRMFWGYGGGLVLDIRDQAGTPVESSMRDDALMPPPMPGDPTPLARIDESQFFGIERSLMARNYFVKPGKYVIRVKYKSQLHPEDLDPRFRSLHALWANSPAIVSDPIWIEIHD